MFCKTLFLALILAFSGKAFSDESSYQKEFVFLNQQLKSLKNRKIETLRQLEKMKLGLEKEVFKLEKDVSSLRGETQVLETKLRVFDQERLDQDQIIDTMKSIEGQMLQMAEQKSGLVFDSFKTSNEFLLNYLNKGTIAHTTKGAAFDKDGKNLQGDLIQLGHVVTLFNQGGVEYFLTSRSKKDQSTLYLYDDFISKKELLGLSKGLSLLPVSFDDGKKIEAKSYSQWAATKLKEGGLVGYIILLLGLLGLALAVLRWSYIKPYENSDSKSLEEVVHHLQLGETKEAKLILEKLKPHPMNEFVNFVLTNLTESKEVYESKIMDRLFTAKKKLNKYGPYLLVLAGVAPLLGLLGTVTGMIETFSMITLYGTGDPKVLSGGIKAALVTTQLGLVVAIPCILLGNYLSSKSSKVMNQFEQLASSIPKD